MPELPEPEKRKTGRDDGPRDAQTRALLEIVGNVVRDQRRLENQQNRLLAMLREHGRPGSSSEGDQPDPHAPAPWVWYSPPAPDEPGGGREEDPRVYVANFVAWYDTVFVGIEGGRAKPIPACWQEKPGLAMEVAALAYSWRAANLGPQANIRDAMYWLDHWRPGFESRMVRDWAHSDCLDGEHRAAGAKPRPNRFDVAEQNARDQQAPSPRPSG